jgi:hypothetical protein
MARSFAFPRRLLAALLAASVAIVGLASQIHLHWQGVDPTVRIASECGHPEPLSSHACLACKVSHRSLSPPPEVGSAVDPPLRSIQIRARSIDIEPPVFHSPASPRAPPELIS